MTIATELATRIVGMGFDALPPEAVHWAKVGVLDFVGVTLAGHAEPCAQLLARVSAASGPALVFGSGRRAAPLDAALINGTASHALDFDDCSDTMGGHPSAQVLTALFALADTLDVNGGEVSGRDLLAAYVAGFETETRIGRAVNFHHYEKGWHPTATLGVFGAAAACAHLLRLDPGAIATALAIAASLSAGLKANFGTMTKPLHVGHAAAPACSPPCSRRRATPRTTARSSTRRAGSMCPTAPRFPGRADSSRVGRRRSTSSRPASPSSSIRAAPAPTRRSTPPSTSRRNTRSA